MATPHQHTGTGIDALIGFTGCTLKGVYHPVNSRNYVLLFRCGYGVTIDTAELPRAMSNTDVTDLLNRRLQQLDRSRDEVKKLAIQAGEVIE